jgi:hypothetical protein
MVPRNYTISTFTIIDHYPNFANVQISTNSYWIQTGSGPQVYKGQFKMPFHEAFYHISG